MIVDILKQYTSTQSGKVYMKQDRYIKKRVHYLDGSVNTLATLSIPVNLKLNYLHFQVQVPSSGSFVISISYDYQGKSPKLSFGNAFKSISYPHECHINFPCDGLPNWGTIIVDLQSFFKFNEITQITITGNIAIKGIYNTKEESLLPIEHQLNVVAKCLLRYKKSKMPPIKGILKKNHQKSITAPLEEVPLPQERISPMKQDILETDEKIEINEKPILKLKHIHGYTPKQFANLLYLDNEYFAFPCGKTIVIMSLKEQKFFSTTNDIQSMCKQGQFIYATSESEIIQFDFTSCTMISSFKIEGLKIKQIQIFEDIIILQANDGKNQYFILIKNESIYIKQASTFPITTFKIQNKDTFISVGRENLRYWHIKGNCLQGHSPYLGQYARETEFTDILIQDKRVLSCCKKGRVFQFIDQELTGVWQISESPITTMNKFNQYVITTHKDCIKYWKPDFTEVWREIKSEVEVIGCDVQSKLICAFRDRSIGIIDETTIRFVVSSHQQNILDIILIQDKIISSAMDYEIRIWNQQLSLDYKFRCLDALAIGLCGLQSKGQFIAAFDNGYIRLFDMKSYTLLLEIDTKEPILAISGNQDDTLFLITHQNQTLVLNNKLLIIKQHSFKCNDYFALNGFFRDMYYIAQNGYIKLYSCDQLTEKFHLNLPITSIDCNNQHLHIVSEGNIKRFDKDMNFLQELISNSNYIKTCNNYVFSCTKKQQLLIYDYHFISDENGNPIKQQYQQNVKKMIISNQIISCVDDFIFIWDTNGIHNSLLQHDIDKAYIQQVIDIIQESQSPKKQQLEKEKKQIKKGKENINKNQKRTSQSVEVQNPSNQKIQSPKEQSPKQNLVSQPLPGQHLNIQDQNKQLIIEDNQLPKIKINKVLGYRFSDKFIQQFPWNQQDQFYVLPSEQFIVINYYTKQQQQLILTQQIKAIHYSIKGIVVILQKQILVFDQKMDLIRAFEYGGNLSCSTVSPCGNYLLMINDDKIQIYILSSGRILTQTIIQYGNGNIFCDWCHDQDLMFVTLSGISNQLWRVNQRSLLEYCDLDVKPYYYQSSGYYKQSLILSQGMTLHNINIKQARTILTIENATTQDITQVICTSSTIILFTNSPNIYLFNYEFNDKQIISLDSTPLGYSNICLNDIIVVTRAHVWFVDISTRVTVKIEPNIPTEHKVLSTFQDFVGTSEGTIIYQNDEILVPKRQCLHIGQYQQCLIAGYSDGFCRLYQDFQLIGQIQVGKYVQSLHIEKNYFIVGNEKGQLYYCTGLKEIKMHEITIEKNEFPIFSIDAKANVIVYSTGNQKVQVIHYKEKEEFVIKKNTIMLDDTPQYFLTDSYRFRSIDQCYVQFNKQDPEQIIMLCGQIIIRNYVEHLNIITIDCQAINFTQFGLYLIVGRQDGTISLYDNEIELDKIQVSTFPIHYLNNNKIGYGNMICELIQ